MRIFNIWKKQPAETQEKKHVEGCPCDICNYVATRTYYLKNHRQNKHKNELNSQILKN